MVHFSLKDEMMDRLVRCVLINTHIIIYCSGCLLSPVLFSKFSRICFGICRQYDPSSQPLKVRQMSCKIRSKTNSLKNIDKFFHRNAEKRFQDAINKRYQHFCSSRNFFRLQRQETYLWAVIQRYFLSFVCTYRKKNLPSTKAWISFSDMFDPGFLTTRALGTCPASLSGAPTTPTSSIPGWFINKPSNSAGAT